MQVNGPGTIDGSVRVVEPVTQSLYLKKGWNLVSFYVKPADFSIKNIFNEYPNEPEEIKGGVSYLLGDGDSETTLTVSEAYWIKVSKSFTINVIGVVPEEDVKQDLKRGLNSFNLTRESIKNVSTRLFFLTKDTTLQFKMIKIKMVFLTILMFAQKLLKEKP